MLEFGFGFVGFWIRKEGKVGVLVTGSVFRHGGIEEELHPRALRDRPAWTFNNTSQSNSVRGDRFDGLGCALLRTLFGEDTPAQRVQSSAANHENRVRQGDSSESYS